MKLLVLNGGSCSGKSTIIKYIMNKKKDNVFQLSYDSLKWLFSNYSSDKHYKDVQKIILSIAKTIFKMKYVVISDSSLYKRSRDKLIALAIRAGYEIVEVNLEADRDVLTKRFEERIASALLSPEKRISNLSKDRYIELLNIFEREKNPRAIKFNTGTQSVEEISESIIKLLK